MFAYVKILISLRIRTVWSESSLSAWRRYLKSAQRRLWSDCDWAAHARVDLIPSRRLCWAVYFPTLGSNVIIEATISLCSHTVLSGSSRFVKRLLSTSGQLSINPCLLPQFFGHVHFNTSSVLLVLIVAMFYRNVCPECKQCIHCSDDAFCGIWSGLSLLAIAPFMRSQA